MRATPELDALWAMCMGPAGRMRLEWEEDGKRQRALVADLARWRRLGIWLADRYDVWAGVQPVGPDGELTGRCHVLWCVAEGRRSCAILGRLRPRPTLTLQEGDNARITALWALLDGLTWDWTVRANRRLAHHVQGPKKYVEPEHMVRLPGSYLRDRVVPLPIRAALNPDALYTAREVVGRLRDAPDPNAWRTRKEAA